MRTQWIGAGAVGLFVTLGLDLAGAAPLTDTGRLVRTLIVGATIAALATFASSLVDWYWILPRVSGVVCFAPCEQPGREQWSAVTSIWYFHRAASTAFVSLAVAGVPLYMLDNAQAGHGVAFWLLVSGGVGALAAGYDRQVPRALWYAFNPPVHVGDRVRTRVQDDDDPDSDDEIMRNVYIVDVSLQGAKYKLLDEAKRYESPYAGRPVAERFASKYDGSFRPLRLPRLRRLEVAEPFCAKRECTGLNWYCRNNPRAHRQTPPSFPLDDGDENT